MLHLEEIIGAGANYLSNSMPVLRSPLKRSQNQQVQRALQNIKLVAHVVDSLPPNVVVSLLLYVVVILLSL